MRDVFSLDINTEDFQAAVDYLINLDNVDLEKVGIIGICGWGGISLNAAANDPRIKATAAITMYDMPRVGAWGYFDKGIADERYQNKKQIAEQRTKEYGTDKFLKLAAVLNIQLDDQPDYVKQLQDQTRLPQTIS